MLVDGQMVPSNGFCGHAFELVHVKGWYGLCLYPTLNILY